MTLASQLSCSCDVVGWVRLRVATARCLSWLHLVGRICFCSGSVPLRCQVQALGRAVRTVEPDDREAGVLACRADHARQVHQAVGTGIDQDDAGLAAGLAGLAAGLAAGPGLAAGRVGEGPGMIINACIGTDSLRAGTHVCHQTCDMSQYVSWYLGICIGYLQRCVYVSCILVCICINLYIACM